MHRGYTKDYRKVKEWEWYRTPHAYQLFRHLIRECNHKEKMWRGVQIKRGQMVTGRKSLSAETGIPESTIYRLLKKFEKSGEIIIEANNKFSIITVRNYEKYHVKKDGNQQPLAQQLIQPLTQQLIHKQEVKEVKEVKNKDNIPAPTTETQMFELMERYTSSQKIVINNIFDAIATTRKTCQVSNNILLSQLKRWDKKPTDHIIKCCELYMKKGYADDGKGEDYLWGIMRNHCFGNSPNKPEKPNHYNRYGGVEDETNS